MRIGIIGARLSGSYAALLLSRLGHEILLFDGAPEREKPCGGGVTAKALRRMAWFRERPLPHNEITTLRMGTGNGYPVDLPLRDPIFIYSRSTLDSSLREAAIRAGTRFIPERALDFKPHRNGYAVVTARSAYEIDFLVGADGSTSSVRTAVAGKYPAADLSLALGFYLPGLRHPDTVVAAFQESGFQGYVWSFPRVDHTSVGILRRLPFTNATDLRKRVQHFIDAHYPETGTERTFYAALIPCLSRRSLLTQRVCGPNWALLGDAAGFADAITAEGIYFALRSAELLADAVRSGDPQSYEQAWRQDFGGDLQKAAEWCDRFYGGSFLFQQFTRRAIQMTARSETVRDLTDNLISGKCSYKNLRRQLILRTPRILIETILSRISRRPPDLKAVEHKQRVSV